MKRAALRSGVGGEKMRTSGKTGIALVDVLDGTQVVYRKRMFC